MCNIYKNASPTSTSWIATSSATFGSEMTAGKRRATGGILTSLTPTHVTTSGSRKFLLAVALFVLLASVNGATDQKTVKPSPILPLSSSASLSATPKDEIYIDDESIEGSGGRGGLHDDLDKDPDYSGSGFGPDDEDSSTDLQPSHRGNNIHTQSGKHNTVLTTDDNDDLISSRTHHQTNSGTIIGSNSGSNSGIIGGNSGSNTGLNTIATTTKQASPSITTNQNTPTLTHITTTTSSATAGKNRGSSLYPNQVPQTHLPAAPHYPAGGSVHTDDEDFDLGEGDDDGAGSGDGDDDDDDHTGDVDDGDEHEGLIERPHQPKYDFGVGKEPTTTIENGTSTSSTTASSTTTSTGSVSSSDSNDRKKILSSHGNDDEHDVDADEEDEFDDTYDEDNKDDDEDDEDDRLHEEDDNTEVYIDGTEPNAKSGSDDQDNERGTTNQGNTIHELDTNNVNSQPTDTKVIEHTTGNEVLIMNTSDDDRTASFFAQPGILAAVIGGAVVGLLCAILVVMFIVYRMRKKDEGSYALDEPKRSPAVNSYAKNANNREFYA
ncbi:syndecan [Bactrocera oleae]|uniref:syndecan n=1 Tax=Bactrocera oleae TaxID=104688 RepID=UPI00387E9601